MVMSDTHHPEMYDVDDREPFREYKNTVVGKVLEFSYGTGHGSRCDTESASSLAAGRCSESLGLYD